MSSFKDEQIQRSVNDASVSTTDGCGRDRGRRRLAVTPVHAWWGPGWGGPGYSGYGPSYDSGLGDLFGDGWGDFNMNVSGGGQG